MAAVGTAITGTIRRRRGAGVVVLALITGTMTVIAPSMSATAAGARVSAHLTQTSFTAAEASQVKLVYTFSARSHRFGYVLARRSASKWVQVRSVSKRGRFRGAHSMRVGRLFGTTPISEGRYRVTVSADANKVPLRFTVTAAAPAVVAPRTGTWQSTSVSGGGGQVSVTGISFEVAPDGKTLTDFTFEYTYSGVSLPPFTQSCSGSGRTYALAGAPTPISDGQFSGPSGSTGGWYQSNSVVGGSGSWTGTFDSATTAHGTARFSWGFVGLGCMRSTGSLDSIPWTATLQQ